MAAEEEGGTVLEHLLAIERQTGRTPQALLDAPPCPEGCEDLWRTFCELDAARGYGAFGASPISYADIDAYQRVSGIRLAAWERAAIRQADNAYLEQRAAAQRKAQH